MQLGEFKKYIESFPEGTMFDFSISEPFSWRGSYCEPAFSLSKKQSSREDILKNVELALTNTFHGYKGGDYKFRESDYINFESEWRSWSDGGYTQQWIEDLTEDDTRTQEEKLIKLMFK